MLVLNLLSAGGPPREKAPLFPLATVLYPDMLLPLRIFEPRYMDMAKACLKHDTPFGVCLIREGAEVGAPAAPEAVGCLARIVDWDMAQLGILKVRAQGLERFRLVESQATTNGLLIGDIERIGAEEKGDVPELDECATFLRKVIEGIGPRRFIEPFRYEDASWVGFRLSEILPLKNPVKQKLLELTDAGARLEVLHRFLKQQKLID
jgi:Lon protease-like protein